MMMLVQLQVTFPSSYISLLGKYKISSWIRTTMSTTTFKQAAATVTKGRNLGRANTNTRGIDLVEDPSSYQSHFFVMATGQVEWGEFDGRYALSYGPDWRIVHGPETGIGQIAQRGGGEDKSIVWNFPLDVTLKSTNAFGWPRLCLSVYRVDHLGRDIVAGYGAMLLPTCPGQYERVVHMFTPEPSSLLQQVRAWITGAHPGFFDSKFAARSEGREVTRVRRTGSVKVSVNILTRGMADVGYISSPTGKTMDDNTPVRLSALGTDLINNKRSSSMSDPTPGATATIGTKA